MLKIIVEATGNHRRILHWLCGLGAIATFLFMCRFDWEASFLSLDGLILLGLYVILAHLIFFWARLFPKDSQSANSTRSIRR